MNATRTLRTILEDQRLLPFGGRLRQRLRANAFTRVELVIVLATLVLLALLTLPVLANTRGRAQRVACLNNLSRIGRAFSIWATDHSQRFPYQVSFRDRGLLDNPSGLQGNLWFQFYSISNELATPTALACPSDGVVKTATDFTTSQYGGFGYAAYRNAAISYFLAHPLLEEGRTILSGDQNLSGPFSSESCQYFLLARSFASFPLGPLPTWDATTHQHTGNLLFLDGSAEQTDNAKLRASVTHPNFGNGSWHYLPPR